MESFRILTCGSQLLGVTYSLVLDSVIWLNDNKCRQSELGYGKQGFEDPVMGSYGEQVEEDVGTAEGHRFGQDLVDG